MEISNFIHKPALRRIFRRSCHSQLVELLFASRMISNLTIEQEGIVVIVNVTVVVTTETLLLM